MRFDAIVIGSGQGGNPLAYALADHGWTVALVETEGFMKIIVDAGTDRILGASILGAEGGELVQVIGALILANAPYTLLKGAVYIHPALVEGFFGLMDSVKPVN